MGHHHEHNHASGNIAVAFCLNLSFTIIELIGGLFTNSVAILSDALHDFGDSISLGMAWYFAHLSKKSATAQYSFGYKRFALLGAHINSAVMLLGSVVVVYECVLRMINPQPVAAKGMLGLAVLGIVINGLAVIKTRHGKGVNERVVSLHMLEDVLGWAAVLIVSIVMMFVNCPILDPLLSIGIALFVLFNVVRNVRTTFRVILQGVPLDVDFEQVRNALLAADGVRDIHDLHLWSLDSEFNIASLHVVVDADLTYEQTADIKHTLRHILTERGFQHCTIEIEHPNTPCTCRCN